VKIATFNINDVNKRLGNLIGWLRAEKPDVVALQEAADRAFPKAAIEKAGYGAMWRAIGARDVAALASSKVCPRGRTVASPGRRGGRETLTNPLAGARRETLRHPSTAGSETRRAAASGAEKTIPLIVICSSLTRLPWSMSCSCRRS